MAMTYYFIDGYDHYKEGDIADKYNNGGGSGTIDNSNTRYSVGQSANGLTKEHDFATTTQYMIVATAWYNTSNTGNRLILRMLENGNAQLSLLVTNGSQIELKRGNYSSGTQLGVKAGAVSLSTWHHIALGARIANTGGQAIVWIDGVKVTGWTGLGSGITETSGVLTGDTSQSASNEYADGFQVGNNDVAITTDDLYVLGGTPDTDVESEYPGDLWVSTYTPDTEGDTIEWTPSTGSDNSNTIDEVPPSNTDYNEAGFAPSTDTFNFSSLDADVGSIKAVQLCTRAVFAPGTSGPQQIKNVVYRSSTEYTDNTHTISATDFIYRDIWTEDPSTGIAWTKTGFEAGQYGYKKVI